MRHVSYAGFDWTEPCYQVITLRQVLVLLVLYYYYYYSTCYYNYYYYKYYQVHGWNGTGEIVPQRFLMRLPSEATSRAHSNGLIINQHPDPSFWLPVNADKI